MATEMRKTGVDVVGDMPWGTHFCLFYETKEDLLETLVSYCKAGLESQEFCLWVVAEPLKEGDARHALKQAVPDFDRYIGEQSIEIVSARDWYLQDGTFDLMRVISGWNEKVARASARGYAGVRVTGDTAWLEKKDWKDFCEYEDSLNLAVANQRLSVLCTYPLAACGASEILDVVRTHQFAVAKRRGGWDVIETAGHKQAKAEIKRLNEELERRVLERTSQLTAVNEELRKEVLERQRAEEALRRSEERWRSVFENSAIGVALTDMNGHFMATNSAYQSIVGYSKEELRSLTFLDLTHEDYRQVNLQQVDELRHGTKTQFQIEKQYKRKDGSLRWVTNNVSLVPGSEMMPQFIMALSEDITERKRVEGERERLRELEADLAHVNRVSILGELAASVSHELKQPIAAAMTNAKTCIRWLKRDQPAVDEPLEATSRILKDGTRATEIIERLRSLYKKDLPQRELVEGNEIIREMVELLRAEANQYAVSIRTDLVADLPKITADRVQLQQVFMNLILNAIEAMKETGGVLTVKTQLGEDGQLLISVSDTGVGLPKEKFEQIFDAFFTTKPQGSGMGLSISRSIVESHGGRLWATANNGRGATFHFILPTSAEVVRVSDTGT